MRETVTFHKTVIGYRHIQHNIPCEDCSDSYSDAYGLYDVAIVADGHGDPSCFRSQSGSAIATNVAMYCLKEFAFFWSNNLGSFRNAMRSPRERAGIIKNLTDTIISKWYEGVQNDLSQRPITEEEYVTAGSQEAKYRSGEHLEHIYGTTLMAALRVVDFLILIHQGDGRCDVFYTDGSVDQPIPWDERCQENVTTSMCDLDAAASIRSCVIDLSEKDVAACYLGSDGVEDSYRNMEGTHLFYQQLSCDLLDRDFEVLDGFMEEKLTTLSREGSADDVSVAGIVSPIVLKKLLSKFKINIRNYNLIEERQALEKKLASMERKHSILYKRCTEAQKQFALLEAEYVNCEKKIDLLLQDIGELQKQLTEGGVCYDDGKALVEDDGVLKKIKNFFAEQDPPEMHFRKELQKKEAALERARVVKTEIEAKYLEAKAQYEKEIAEFETYDGLYKNFIQKIENIDNQMNRTSVANEAEETRCE